MNPLGTLRSRFGDFWWHALLLFCATRLGDVVNAFIGLWLVPRYVPQEELGAVLPLTQFASTLALPLAVFGTTFMKYVGMLSVAGERGQVKSLMRGVFLAMAVVAVLGLAVSHVAMEPVLERLRVKRGMLGALILATGFAGVVAPVYTSALQALKRFRELSFMTALGAPLRLAMMLVAMPFRALSGYFAAQTSVSLWQIGFSVFALRRELGADVESVPFWNRENTRAFLKYAGMVALCFVPSLAQFVEMLLIRQRLPAVESAAYYMISRFAEIGSYVGGTLIALVFPYAAEASQRGRDADAMLVRTSFASLAFGLVCACGFLVCGRWMLALLPGGEAYVSYVPQLAALTVALSLFAAFNCASTGEVAAGRFGFLWWFVPLHVLYSTALLLISGYGHFAHLLPHAVEAWFARVNATGMDWIIAAMLILQVVKGTCVIVPIIWRRRAKERS
jgi:O-antigen/teichoic acid export membrane protein